VRSTYGRIQYSFSSSNILLVITSSAAPTHCKGTESQSISKFGERSEKLR